MHYYTKSEFLLWRIVLLLLGRLTIAQVVEVNETAVLPCYAEKVAGTNEVAWYRSTILLENLIGIYKDGETNPWKPEPDWDGRTDVVDMDGALELKYVIVYDDGNFSCEQRFSGLPDGDPGATNLMVYARPSSNEPRVRVYYNDDDFQEFGQNKSCSEFRMRLSKVSKVVCIATTYPEPTAMSIVGQEAEQICEEDPGPYGTTCTVTATDVDVNDYVNCTLSYEFNEISITQTTCVSQSALENPEGEYKVCEEKHFPASISLNTIAVVVCILVLVLLLLCKIANICVLVAIVVIELLLVTGGATAMGLCEAWKTDADVPPMGKATIAMMALSVFALLVVIVVVLFTGSKVKAREAAVR